MYNEISDSLSNNLSSIQLNLFDFGLEDAKERVVKLALKQPLTDNMNENYQILVIIILNMLIQLSSLY